MSTPRRLAAFAATLALTVGLSAAPVMAAGPMTHLTLPATDNPSIPCGDHTYTFTSGAFTFVFKDPEVGAHITARDVRAVDAEGAVYRVLGQEMYSPTSFTPKLMFVAESGGITDTLNVTAHRSPNGTEFWFDFGTCSFE